MDNLVYEHPRLKDIVHIEVYNLYFQVRYIFCEPPFSWSP